MSIIFLVLLIIFILLVFKFDFYVIIDIRGGISN